ncbi:hypothetical protein Droror1_Dr00018825 [Drosera rotundifolia]
MENLDDILGGELNASAVAADSLSFNNGSPVEIDPVALGSETSPFLEQRQGRVVSFMRSNVHGARESDRTVNTSELEGLALKLVQGDQNVRNWWRKLEVVRELVLGNMLPVPFIILYLKKLATFLAGKNKSAARLLNMLFEREPRRRLAL